MTTSTRVQFVLGISAAFAAYLLLIVYNGGKIDLAISKPSGHAEMPSLVATPPGAQQKR